MIGRLFSTAVALVVVGMCGSASAATLAVEDQGRVPPGGAHNMWIVYRADAGEVNHLTITVNQQLHRVTFKDPLIVIRPDTAHGDLATTQQACVFLGTSVTCDVSDIGWEFLTYQALLGDKNDSVATKGTDDFHFAILDGGPGNDRLRAGITGHDSTDMIGGPGSDDFDGGGGGAVVDYPDRTQGVTVTADDRADDGAPGERDNVHSNIDDVYGTDYDDALSGGAHGIGLVGGGGNDTLIAGSADSYLDGGDGDDTIRSGQGSDQIRGGDGDDRIFSRDSSVDHVRCDTGSDAVTADASDDVAADCESVSLPATGLARLGG